MYVVQLYPKVGVYRGAVKSDDLTYALGGQCFSKRDQLNY